MEFTKLKVAHLLLDFCDFVGESPRMNGGEY